MVAVIKGAIARKKGKSGFASMNKEKQVLIASKGGRRAHELGRAHEFTAETAQAAGRIGGRKRVLKHVKSQ